MLPVFWIHGNYYDSQQYWHNIINVLGGDVNVEIFFCGYKSKGNNSFYSTASDIIKSMKQVDMFDNRPHVVKLKGIPEDYALINDYLSLCNNRNVLVIDGPVGYRHKPPSKRFVSAANSKLYKNIKSNGKYLESPIEVKTPQQAMKWIRGVVQSSNKDIEKEALELLVAYKGKNLDLLYGELSKILIYVKGKKIKVQDIHDCCVSLHLSNIWKILDNLDLLKYNDAMSGLQEFYQSAGSEAGSSFYGDIMKLLGALYQHYLFLLLMKDTCGKQINSKKAHAAVSGMFKKKTDKDGSVSWNNPVFNARFVNWNINKETIITVLGVSKKRIYSYFLELNRCKLLCRKYSNNNTRLKMILDSFVMVVCGKISPEQSVLVR